MRQIILNVDDLERGLVIYKGETCVEKYRPGVTIEDPHHPPEPPYEITPWQSNIIVDASGKLLAALCKEEGGYGGFQYIAVGSGQEAWDTEGVPDPSPSTTQLVNELARAAASVIFLDESNEETATVTNKLEVAGVFASGVGESAPWREWCIFGGTATGSANSGVIVDYATHSALPKSLEEWTRKVRIIF